MSTGSQSEVHDVGESKQEALRALLNSLVPGGQMSFPKDADVSKLAEKLDELLASKGGLTGVQASIARDEQGRPLNEEGLPIMEIIEPVKDDSVADRPPTSETPLPSSVLEQAPLSPLPNWALSPAALAARRRERDRILDLLEREEEAEFARESVAARNEVPTPELPHKSLRTLDQIVRNPLDTSRPLPNLTAAPTNVSVPPGDTNTPIPQSSVAPDAGILNTGTTRKPKKQKSVSFADQPPSDHSNDQSHANISDIDWGDVVLAPFNPRNPRKSGANVMKEIVVERASGQPAVPHSGKIMDSDDEEELAEDEDHISQEDESDTEVPTEALRPSVMSDGEDDDDEEPAASVDETDFDEAMLQREIALAYYARRNQFGQGVISGPLFDSNTTNQMTNDDRGEAESDMDSTSNATRFRRSRLAGDPQALINSAVQFGKLVDGQLVAEETADQEVEAPVDEVTGRSGGNNEGDMTEKTIALLMHGENIPQGESNGPLTSSEHAQVPPPGAAPASTALGNVVASRPQIASEHKAKSKPQARPVASSSRKPESSGQPNSIPAGFPSMIIESGFGFDPAFQVAPKPKAAATKPVAPMSETVKERSSAPVAQSAGHGRGKSRFAQAATREAKSQPVSTTPNAETSSAPLGGNVVERAGPAERIQSPEPNKRISRFRAERAGYM